MSWTHDDIKPEDVASIEMWYDPYARSWIVQLKDSDGNQLGDADYSYHKDQAEAQVKRWKEQYGITTPKHIVLPAVKTRTRTYIVRRHSEVSGSRQ